MLRLSSCVSHLESVELRKHKPRKKFASLFTLLSPRTNERLHKKLTSAHVGIIYGNSQIYDATRSKVQGYNFSSNIMKSFISYMVYSSTVAL